MSNRLKIIRLSKEYSQAELARTVGVSRQTLNAIEAGKQEAPLQTALRIADVLGLRVDEIFPKEDPNLPQLAKQLQDYQALLNSLFGKGSCQINTNQKNGINNFVGAIVWNKSEAFDPFGENFIARLKRLMDIYQSDEKAKATILKLAKDVGGTKNCEGAYGELAAIDFMSRAYLNHAGTPMELDVTIPASRTFAHRLKKLNANVDGYMKDWNLYVEVKTMQDVVEGILSKPMRELGTKYGAMIMAERDSDYDFNILQPKLAEIENELEDALKAHTNYAKITCVPDLGFRIGWPPAVIHTSRTLNPHRDALFRHKVVFDYAKKFVTDAPFVLIFTVPPWTNNNLVHDGLGYPREFFRAFSRRVFVQYINKPDLHPEYGISFDELSRTISAVVFLQIHDGLGDARHDISGFAFENPNAKNKCLGILRDFLRANNVTTDSFEFDNY